MDIKEATAISQEYADIMVRYKRTMRISCVISMLSSVLAVYLVVYKTPLRAYEYKKYLLNIVAWSCSVDLIVSILHMPQFLFPVIGLCVGGLFENSHSMTAMIILMYLFVTSLFGIGLSVITAFVYRLNVVKKSEDIAKYPVVVVAISMAHTLVPTLICAPMVYAVLYDIVAVKEEIRRTRLGLYLYVEGRTCSFLSTTITPFATYTFVVIIGVVVCSAGAAAIGCAIAILRSIRRCKGQMSHRTYLMHKQLTMSLIVQFVVPFTFVVMPLALMLYYMLTQQDDSTLKTLCVVVIEVISLHSTFNTLSMIIMTKPYREYVLAQLLWAIRFLPYTSERISKKSLQPRKSFAPTSRSDSITKLRRF